MIYSPIEFHEKQGWSTYIMSEATKAKKRKYKEGNTVPKIWERKE